MKALGSLLSCSITRLVGVPQLLTVVTELCATAVPATGDFRTACTPEGDNCISTVWSRTPAAVRVSHKPPPQHELLIFVHERLVSQDHADVVWVEAL